MRIPMIESERLAPEFRAMVEKWQADGGDPNFIRTFGRLPEALKRFVAFYSPLVRKGLVEHRSSWGRPAGRRPVAFRRQARRSVTA